MLRNLNTLWEQSRLVTLVLFFVFQTQGTYVWALAPSRDSDS
jgi:hypothetical protein